MSYEILGAASSSRVLIFGPRLTGDDQSVGPQGAILLDTHRSDFPCPPVRAEAKKSVISSLARLGCQSFAVVFNTGPALVAGSQQQKIVGGGVGVGVLVRNVVGVLVGGGDPVGVGANMTS
jgi:hypothetical protein